MLQYVVAQDHYISKSNRHQYLSPSVKIWRTLSSGPIQMLSSHRTTTRVDLQVQIYTFFHYQRQKRMRFSVIIQKISKIKSRKPVIIAGK